MVLKNTIKVYDKMTVGQMTLEEVRSLASRETGLPVGIYRLTTRDGREMFDGHTLEDYHVDLGHTIYLENMDGWNKFLNLAIIGFTQQVRVVLSKHPSPHPHNTRKSSTCQLVARRNQRFLSAKITAKILIEKTDSKLLTVKILTEEHGDYKDFDYEDCLDAFT